MDKKDGDPPKHAIDRASHLTRPLALDKPQKALLDEALLEAGKVVAVVEDAVLGFGRWLLVHVFESDTRAALSDRSDNAVWLELLRRAGGPTLKLNDKALQNCVRVAAYERRISHGTFRGLDYNTKELLLPLGDEQAIAQAAKHVSDLALSQKAVGKYVDALRREQGKPREPRITVPRLHRLLETTHERLSFPHGKRRLEKLAANLSKEERAAMQAKLRAVIDAAHELQAILRGR